MRRGDRDPGDDLPAGVLPALGLDETHNPSRLRRDRDALAAWAWLASRYRHEGHDLQGLLDPSANFFGTIALEFGDASGRQEPTIRLSLPDAARKRYDRLSCAERAPVEARFWAMSRPLHLTSTCLSPCPAALQHAAERSLVSAAAPEPQWEEA